MINGLMRWLGILAFVYFVVASLTFNIRHPWATDMEIWMHMGDALTFGTVDYWDMRPRP